MTPKFVVWGFFNVKSEQNIDHLRLALNNFEINSIPSKRS